MSTGNAVRRGFCGLPEEVLRAHVIPFCNGLTARRLAALGRRWRGALGPAAAAAGPVGLRVGPGAAGWLRHPDTGPPLTDLELCWTDTSTDAVATLSVWSAVSYDRAAVHASDGGPQSTARRCVASRCAPLQKPWRRRADWTSAPGVVRPFFRERRARLREMIHAIEHRPSPPLDAVVLSIADGAVVDWTCASVLWGVLLDSRAVELDVGADDDICRALLETVRARSGGASWTALTLRLSGGPGVTDVGAECLADALTNPALVPHLRALRVDLAFRVTLALQYGLRVCGSTNDVGCKICPGVTRKQPAFCPLLYATGGAYGGAARLWAAAQARRLSECVVHFHRRPTPHAERPHLEVPGAAVDANTRVLSLSAAGCSVSLQHAALGTARGLRSLNLDLRTAHVEGGVRALAAALQGCGAASAAPLLHRLQLRLPDASWVRDDTLPKLLAAVAVGMRRLPSDRFSDGGGLEAPRLSDLWLDVGGVHGCTLSGVGRACTSLTVCRDLRPGSGVQADGPASAACASASSD